MSSADPYADLTVDSLTTSVVGSQIVSFLEIDSTNTYALDHGWDGMVVVADRQSAGRGRLGRSWHSAPGKGIWFTVALDGVLDGLVFAAALAVRDAISDRCMPQIKWPNDILINGRKVCGILTEHRAGTTALGIGINVHHTREDFPEELRQKAGSLTTEAESDWDRVEVLRAVLNELDRRVILLRNGEFAAIRDEWAAACALIGRRIQTDSATGIVTAIDDDGALLLDTADGEARVISGEIHLIDETDEE